MTTPVTVTAEDIQHVRTYADETTLTDPEVAALIAANSDEDGTLNLDRAVAAAWRRKAASYARMMDVSESGSSRKMSDLHKNALAMAGTYDKRALPPVPVAVGPVVRVNSIERP